MGKRYMAFSWGWEGYPVQPDEQSINKAARLLTSFLDMVTWMDQLCALNYTKWNAMLPAYKHELLWIVQVENKLIIYVNLFIAN